MSPDNQQSPATGKSNIDIDFLTATINDLQEYLRDGKVTSVELIRAYLNRIEANNRKGLELRAVMETAPVDDLLAMARTCDEMRAKGHPLGKLHGIPLLVKDNIATEPNLGMHTTAGSYALVNSIPKEDATVIAKLRAAGAIILGKTTMTEFGNCKYSKADWGWSARGGQPLSAYVGGGYPAANPEGSSSGSAIALSAGWAPATLGTETCGSLISPTGRAAGYTLRSTVGLISRYGVIPVSTTLDTVGPIAKSAHDIALLVECMSGYDAKDPATHAAQGHILENYTEFTELPHARFRGMRLGVPRHGVFDVPGNSDWRDATFKSAFDTAIRKMETLGATIYDPAEFPSYDVWKVRRATESWEIIRADLKEGLAEYLRGMQSTDVLSLRDIIEFAPSDSFNLAHRLLDADASEGRKSVEYGNATASREYLFTPAYYVTLIQSVTVHDIACKVKRLCMEEGVDNVMDQYRLDALILPINGLAANYAAYGGLIHSMPGGTFGLTLLDRAAYEANFPPRAVPTLLQ
ncbi:hypothetical protein QFC21_006897 [Naganishia friedmannii]|uniref:Uncharacterized protein n=1 Tax=Naganishia friedmannii TaxID=89922 RepID=A0ACC2UZ94_9TREE|nr:hypothetical protein QFC21_006897 [Naganishia friedmannii]